MTIVAAAAESGPRLVSGRVVSWATWAGLALLIVVVATAFARSRARKRQWERTYGVRVCAGCGVSLPTTAKFCAACGGKV